MRLFQVREIKEALAYAAAGGQALHVMPPSYLPPDRPRCFRADGAFAHLFDQDRSRLVRTAQRLGVRSVCVHRGGEEGQHVDLCGQPFRKAFKEAD